MLVAGAGPAGLVAGITLARYGINVLVIDKRQGVSALSRALVISTRGMELMRRWGLEDAVRTGAPDVVPRAWVTETLACGVGTEMPLGLPSDEEAAAVSPSRPAWAPQDHHEPILLAHLREMPSVTVRFGCELTGLSQDRAGVHAVLLDAETTTTSQVDAQYVIAADGPTAGCVSNSASRWMALTTLPTTSGSSSPRRSPERPLTGATPST